jgi:hypothetical protein
MEDLKIDSKINNNIEITTNFYKNPYEVNINLKRNEDLAKMGNEIFNKFWLKTRFIFLSTQ